MAAGGLAGSALTDWLGAIVPFAVIAAIAIATALLADWLFPGPSF